MKNDIIAFISKHKFLLYTPVLVFLLIAALPPCWSIFMYITGTSENPKLEVLKLVGWGISGLIAIFGVVGLFQRAEALDKQNIINEKNHKQRADDIEKGHVQERFKAATEHLGNEQVSVRIAAFYEFYHLAKTKKDWQISIFYILCAHLRHTTKHKDYNKEVTKKIKPTEEVKILLIILFTQRDDDDTIFDKLIANLEGVNLQGADLREALLKGANLQGANLQEADLEKAFLQEAFLQGADLQGADLRRANINKTTTMPHNWENVVHKDENGKTGVIFVED